MKTTKKLIALTLAVLMLTATLVACGGNDDSNTPSGGTPSTQQTPSENNPDTQQTPTDGDPTPVNGGTPAPAYGTIPMPDGFPSNLGDAEFFNPITDDYLIVRLRVTVSHPSWEAEEGYYLVSYDANGEMVQWVSKAIWPSADDVYQEEPGVELPGWSNHYATEGIVVENVAFLDFMVGWPVEGLDDEGMFNRTAHLRGCGIPPTKDQLFWEPDDLLPSGLYPWPEGSYMIVERLDGHNRFVEAGLEPGDFYFSKP